MKKPDAAALPAKHTARTQVDQHARFIKAARELGADEDEATFKAKLAAIARVKPTEPPPKPKKDFACG